MNINDVTIRQEKKEEYRDVENLIRASFWNVYKPGCSEHFVIHVLRDDPAFVKELDFVMLLNGSVWNACGILYLRFWTHTASGKKASYGYVYSDVAMVLFWL